ncbi:MAG: hypothetical protein ACRDV0_07020 [Acidimicrobiales bacterium]
MVAAMAASTVLSMGTPASGAMANQLPTGRGCEASLAVRPSTVILSCADENSYFGSLTWASWGRTADATGQYLLNSCVPSCAQSTVRSRGVVRVVASDPTMRGHGRPVFLRLTVTLVARHVTATLRWIWASSLTAIGYWKGPAGALFRLH